jgi:NADH dehydrogenase FAD-containing subunit
MQRFTDLSRVSAAKVLLTFGAGFSALAAAKRLSKERSLQVMLVDQRNHRLIQPLLDRVANHG